MMTIYVDELRYYDKFPGYASCCHLWTDGPIEEHPAAIVKVSR